MAKLSQKEIDKIRYLYIEKKLSQNQIVNLTKHSICAVNKYCKGLRSRSEGCKLAHTQNGMYKLTNEGRKKLSDSGKAMVKRNKKFWTKPEREFKIILNSIDIGVKFPDYVKEVFDLKDDDDPTICFQYPVQRYVCDFVDVNMKIVYRVNGDFWHGNPILYTGELTKIQKHNQIQDRNCKIFLEKRGFYVCDIWESEIYWNKELVIGKIRAARKKANPPVLHTGNTGSVTQVAHDWSKRLKELWFKKQKEKKKKKIIKCLVCGNGFIPDKKTSRYCSIICSHKKLRRTKWPEKHVLKKEIDSMSWCAIGRKYNVSDNAVRKWARNYDLM